MNAPSLADRNVMAVLCQAGYCKSRKLTQTLQGTIWSSHRKKIKEAAIVKVTSRKLHKDGMIVVDGKKYSVSEDILKEQNILKFLTAQTDGGRQGVVRHLDFFKSNTNFYFVMEHGGHMLFDFVVRVHRYIESGKLDLDHWREFVRVLFVQIVEAVQSIHKYDVCHYDISLENLLINDVEVVLDSCGKITFCTEGVRVKLCDFGLAERDDNDEKGLNSESTKFCGKPNYKSPECASEKQFNARANDTWCVGVCLFMMLIGGNLYNSASLEDKSFAQVMKGQLAELLQSWDRSHYVDDQLLDLLQSIFRKEGDRLTLHKVAQHPWTSGTVHNAK